MSTRAAVERGAFEQALRDRGAADYDDWYRRTKGVAFDRRERAVFRGRAGTRGRVLDLGAGTGRITDALRDLPFVVPVDFSQPSLRRLADKSLTHATPVLGDATAVPLQSGACDLVVSCQVLQHLDAARLAAALRECGGVWSPAAASWSASTTVTTGGTATRARRSTVPTTCTCASSRPRSSPSSRRAAGFRRVRGGSYKALPDGGRVPERLTRWYGRFDTFVCRVFRRRGGCYLVYEGVRVT